MSIYSHSKLATYENCPQQYKLRYVDRIRLPEGEGEGIEAFLGSRVHEVLEKLHKELILSKLNSLDELLKYYDVLWKRNWHKNVVIVKKGFNKSHYKKAGREAIRSYYKRYHPFDSDKTLATEQLVTFRLGDYTLRGYIDRLSRARDGAYEIHDYKTSWSLPPQEKFDSDRQLALYHIGIKEKYRDARDVKLLWHYLLFDHRFESQRTPAQLRDLKKEVVSLIKKIEKEEKFKPVESALCDWCEYPAYCTAKKHEAKVESLPPNKYLKDKGVSLVNEYASIKMKVRRLRERELTLQQELDLIADAAIAYARKEGVSNIAGSDYVLNVVEETVLRFPHGDEEGREELERYLKKSGIWDDVSGLNIKRLTGMINAGELDDRRANAVLKYAEEVEEAYVKLVKKRGEE